MLLLTLRDTYALNRLSRFKNLRRKGGKFDHRPWRRKILLRHCCYGAAKYALTIEDLSNKFTRFSIATNISRPRWRRWFGV